MTTPWRIGDWSSSSAAPWDCHDLDEVADLRLPLVVVRDLVVETEAPEAEVVEPVEG